MTVVDGGDVAYGKAPGPDDLSFFIAKDIA